MTDIVEKTSNAPKTKSRRDDRYCRKKYGTPRKPNPVGMTDIVEKSMEHPENQIQ
jgi:hypothetical protein